MKSVPAQQNRSIDLPKTETAPELSLFLPVLDEDQFGRLLETGSAD